MLNGSLRARRSGPQTGVGAVIALCSALLSNPLKGGLIVVGINLRGSIDLVHNPIDVVELALEKGLR